MKRSRRIVLALSGALATSALVGCRPSDEADALIEESGESESYTNNHFVLGAGYYHAPYHAWYPYPYNWYVAGHGYYHGGNWTDEPEQSPITSSSPTPSAARSAGVGLGHSSRSSSGGKSSSVTRGGFGGSAHSSGT